MVKDEYRVGTLVQLDNPSSHAAKKYGLLWILKTKISPNGMVRCRSIATGRELYLHHHDLTPSKQEGE